MPQSNTTYHLYGYRYRPPGLGAVPDGRAKIKCPSHSDHSLGACAYYDKLSEGDREHFFLTYLGEYTLRELQEMDPDVITYYGDPNYDGGN